jgi:hypothetical protein
METEEPYIPKLIRLFRELEKLAGQVPSRNPEIWDRCRVEALHESDVWKRYYAEAEKDPTTWEYLKQNSLIETPGSWKDQIAIHLEAHKKYDQADPMYSEKLSTVQNQINEVMKQIDFTLLPPIKVVLLRHGRTGKTLLAKNWERKRHASAIVKWKDTHQITKTIEALEYVEREINLQKKIAAKSMQQNINLAPTPPPTPAKIELGSGQTDGESGDSSKPPGKDGQGKPPDDSMTLTVAISRYHVSKTTLRRAIEDGRLKDYSDKAKPKNSPAMISEREVARHWKKK